MKCEHECLQHGSPKGGKKWQMLRFKRVEMFIYASQTAPLHKITGISL